MSTANTSNRPKKYQSHKSHSKRPLAFRSKVTNGNALLPGVDGRSIWARRFRALINLHTEDRGGIERASEAEKALIRRAAALITELERYESRFALNDGAKRHELETYQRAANSLRRLLESLGLKRAIKDITPDDHETSFERFIDHLDAEVDE